MRPLFVKCHFLTGNYFFAYARFRKKKSDWIPIVPWSKSSEQSRHCFTLTAVGQDLFILKRSRPCVLKLQLLFSNTYNEYQYVSI